MHLRLIPTVCVLGHAAKPDLRGMVVRGQAGLDPEVTQAGPEG